MKKAGPEGSRFFYAYLEYLIHLNGEHGKTGDNLGIEISRFLGHLLASVSAIGYLFDPGRVEDE